MSERNFTVSEAESRIRKIIHSLGYEAMIERSPKTPFVATASLMDAHKNIIASGAGKGKNCIIGALAESVEHHTILNLPQSSLDSECKRLISQQETKIDGLIRNLPNTNETINCAQLKHLNNSKSILVPSVLLSPTENSIKNTLPHPNQKYLLRYSTNSGSAFGCNHQESILHGINETIERHILSTIYLELYTGNFKLQIYKAPVKIIERVLENHENTTNFLQRVNVFIIDDFFGLFFCIAYGKRGKVDIPLIQVGSGCSLSINTAVERAVTEYIQAETLYGKSEYASDQKSLKMLSKSVRLSKLIKLEELEFFPRKMITKNPSIHFDDLDMQLDHLQKEMHQINREIFYRTLADFTDLGTVTQVYIPGLERFHLIRNGYFVAPQEALNRCI